MDIDQLLAEGREIWGEDKMSLDEIVAVIGVVYGDICRQARAVHEGGQVDDTELKKEFGNLIFSFIRWCHDMGYDPKECVALAQQTQRRYVQNMG